jgi:hypothetical protein
MGKDDRKALSRIKLENLPKAADVDDGATKVGPLGILRLEYLVDDGMLLYLGPFGPFAIPGRWSCVKV